ncbi:MAG: hypothetical protein IKW07_00320, partial [Clostridia bacterium]|nr:hypothetical protein [Clostridia bacterium]
QAARDSRLRAASMIAMIFFIKKSLFFFIFFDPVCFPQTAKKSRACSHSAPLPPFGNHRLYHF